MEDKIEDENLEKPTENQPNNLPELEINNPIEETENMEVHHHAHDPAMPHHKKNWKSYFWEFMMLFLAVFCGFLAELQLEHTIEHNREKEFIISLVKEMENDDQQINQKLRDTVRNSTLDSLVVALYDLDKDPKNIKKAYALVNNTGWFEMMVFNKNTITQLKYGGNMRLIRNRQVVDSINVVDNLINELEDQIKAYQGITITNIQYRTKIFDGRYLFKFKKSKGKLTVKEFMDQQLNINYLEKDEKQRITYAETVAFQKAVYDMYVEMLKNYQHRSRKILPFIKKEYHLDE